ncbi:MAG: lamin tail domain-containing protein [Bacteroidota bacterium]
MKQVFITLILICVGYLATAQFSDDFSDGDFTSNPEWTGETSKFQVSAANELQLYDDTESGSAYLSTASQAINNASWEFLVRFDFNPSSANYANVYLTSDQNSLDGNLNGYFVKIGNTSDEISLYRQDGDNQTEIIDGTDDRVNNDPVNVRVKVTRDDTGNWTLQSDTLGGTNYYTEGSIFDDTHLLSQYSGVHCTFSSTRWDKIFFDDFVVQEDTIAPEIISADFINNHQIEVFFSEVCSPSTMIDNNNYNLNSIGNPEEVLPDNQDHTRVVLNYPSTSFSNIVYNLEIDSVTDYVGNLMNDTVITLQENSPPEIDSVQLIDNTHLLIIFSEPMDSASTLNTANYTVNNGIGAPANAEFEAGNSATVLLTFSNAFADNTEYYLQYQNCEDLFGNSIETGNISFANVVIEEYDIVFNEIMADPTPAVGLPEHEYLEIYNTRNLPVNLSGWTLVVGSTEYSFPAVSIEADDQLILCKDDAVPEFEALGKTAGMGFSTYTLTNGGTTLKLFNADSVLIDEVAYTDDWYQDPDKDDGGWSIERMDPWNTCSGMFNWKASINQNGGTPGATNSIFGQNQDNYPPEILSWELSSANEITLTFSETPDTLTSLDPANYNLEPGFGQPFFVSSPEDNPRKIRLQFTSAFLENTFYTLTVSNIADNCGNTLEETEITFIKYIAGTFDVLITEIMADPAPPVYLPEAEYIELHNLAEYPINLAGWTLKSGSSEYALPAAEIPVDGYICIAEEGYESDFSNIPNMAFAENLPLFPNTSGELQIISKEGNLIDFLNYSSTWYDNDEKAKGGWSLEMIDPANPCGTDNNWTASVDPVGGTPGEENSVMDSNPDMYIPEVMRAIINKPDSLLVLFDEALHPDFVPDSSKFTVDNGIGNPVFIQNLTDQPDALNMAFSQPFEAGIVYTLEISDTITDCAGNQLSETVRIEFALSDSVENGDVVINEILFNPRDGGSDYVELYNRSDKFIDLRDLRMATRDDSLRIENLEIITDKGFLLFPGDYVVLSENTGAVNQQYYCKYPEQLLQVDDLPAYANAEGDVVLCLPNMDVIDEVVYNEDMHFKLLRSVDGVSLERINYDRPASDEDNWHSAAENVGFGTPTYENSQYQSSPTTESMFEITPETFSPDNDGYQDVLNISYKMDNPGYVLSISVYDAKGHPVRKLVENELLGMEGLITWDGLNENGQHPGRGIYILLFDYFDVEGNRHQEKKTVVIAVKQ